MGPIFHHPWIPSVEFLQSLGDLGLDAMSLQGVHGRHRSCVVRQCRNEQRNQRINKQKMDEHDGSSWMTRKGFFVNLEHVSDT